MENKDEEFKDLELNLTLLDMNGKSNPQQNLIFEFTFRFSPHRSKTIESTLELC